MHSMVHQWKDIRFHNSKDFKEVCIIISEENTPKTSLYAAVGKENIEIVRPLLCNDNIDTNVKNTKK